MKDHINVRLCRYNEAEKIQNLTDEVMEKLRSQGKDTYFGGVSRSAAECCMRDPSFIIGVFGEDNEELLGYCLCEQMTNEAVTERYMNAFELPRSAKPFVWILNGMAVKPSAQNLGISSLLFVNLMAALSAKGTEQYLMGTVHPDNQKMLYHLDKCKAEYGEIFTHKISRGELPRRRFCVRVRI